MNFLGIFLVMFPMSAAVKPVSKDGKPCTLRHFKKASLGNQALRPSNLISSHNVHLLAECHIHCVNAGNCYGYNFRVRPSSVYTVNCQLSNSSVKMNMTKMRNGSWNFYEDVLVTNDIDECSEDSHGCRADATCVNTPGSYNCTCPSGAYIARDKYCQNLKVVSQILKNEPNEFENKLREWLPRTGDWSRCWRATRNGWAWNTFQSRCDGKSPTLTLVQVIKNSKTFVFGGYATVPWKRHYNHGHYTSAPGSFLFSLRNKDDLPPFKAPLKNKKHGLAIYRYGGYGPTFGGGHDLHIANDAKSNTNSYTNFGNTYQPPPGYTYDQANTYSLLAGSYKFTPSEVEVLYLN